MACHLVVAPCRPIRGLTPSSCGRSWRRSAANPSSSCSRSGGWASVEVVGAHVLVVDDDPQILRMLSEVLTKRGFGVDVARDGEEAYGRALQRPPDRLVTDVMMPKLDGWSLVRKLRLDPKLANLPVIFLTAVTTDDARVNAFRLGADDYVNKPFKFNDL